MGMDKCTHNPELERCSIKVAEGSRRRSTQVRDYLEVLR